MKPECAIPLCKRDGMVFFPTLMGYVCPEHYEFLMRRAVSEKLKKEKIKNA